VSAGTFSFTVKDAANCSAGVYNYQKVLIRTLWSLVHCEPGDYIDTWDGNDDFGNVATDGPFIIKVLSSNATYLWEGVIGNTSENKTGNTILRSTYPPRCLFATQSYTYWALGYGEVFPATCKTITGRPGVKSWINMQTRGGYVQSDFVCADGINVYWGATDPVTLAHTFIWGTKVSNDSVVAFPSGISLPQGSAVTYQSVIGYVNDANGTITGMAVQKSGNYLFVSRAGLSQLLILNKTTGAVVQTLIYSGAGQLSIDATDKLWMAYNKGVEKFTVNADGTLTTTGILIPLLNVGGIAVNFSNTTIILADITTQTVKAYNTSAGDLLWTLGTGVSYQTDARVEKNKFFWRDINGSYKTFLCFLADGSFYVGDGKNYRIQHFGANRQFIDSISYLGNQYRVSVDPNNPGRVFSQFLEFKVDYSKPYSSSWQLVNNWIGNCPARFVLGTLSLVYPVTLSNGRTYAYLKDGPAANLVELVSGAAVRFTGIVFPNQNFNPVQDRIDADGSRLALAETIGFVYGTQFQIKRYPFTGFDANNNPIWGTIPTVTTTPVVGSHSVKGNQSLVKTLAGNWIHFDLNKSSTPVTDPHATGQGYHIGAIPEGGSAYKWCSAPATNRDTYTGPYPGQGNKLGHYFDVGNGVNYPGGFIDAVDNHVLWSYHGEGWKGGQLNMYYHLYDDNIGLAAGSFGTNIYLYPNNTNDIGNLSKGKLEGIWGGAGNALQGAMCKVNGNTYLYHGDEGYHCGIHRWKLRNLESIRVQTAIFPSAKTIAPPAGIDLLKGFVRGGLFVNGQNGWTRSPLTDFKDTTGSMITGIGTKNYDPSASPSLSINGVLATAPTNFWASRSLQNTMSLPHWSLAGQVLYDANIPSDNANHGQMLEVLDNKGLRIVQFYLYLDRSLNPIPNQIRANGVVIASGANPSQALFDLMNYWHSWTQLSIIKVNRILKIIYGPYAPVHVNVVDKGADMNIPATMRLYFFTTGTHPQGNGMSIALQNFRFRNS